MTSLNKEQEEAINHGEGPLLIIAGAGTGKTTVITERIKRLVTEKHCEPSEILALTFTDKAAAEMEERVDIALPYGATSGMWIMTFHSFCDRILRDEAINIGLNPKFNILTGSMVVDFFKKNLFKFNLDYFLPLGNPTKFVEGLAKHFSRLQDENISPKEYLEWATRLRKSSGEAKNEPWEELSQAYEIYEKLKIEIGVMDYGDLIVNTLKLFQKRPQILDNYQNQFKYILVDEFQDTNFAQNELINLLANKSRNITVVGDDDQSVYKFRGAAVSNILQFRQHFSDAKVVVLTKNYRSNQNILDSAYRLITNNNPDRLEVVESIDKRLVSLSESTGDVFFIHCNKGEDEAEEIVEKIKELQEEHGYEYKDFAILVRANSHADLFTSVLERNGIPFKHTSQIKLFEKPIIQSLISYLRVIVNFEDSQSLFRLLCMEELNISMMEIIKLGNLAKKQNKTLFEVCEESENKQIVTLIKITKTHIEESKTISTGKILYDFLDKTKILNNLLKPSDGEALEKAKLVTKFFNKLKSFELSQKKSDIRSVLDSIETSIETGESTISIDDSDEETDGVNILTIHGSKGLEYKVVFMVNLVNLRFPSVSRKDQIPLPDEIIREQLPVGDAHLQEERRLFYVGMTRAKEYLFLTAADYYSDAKRPKKISNFVYEALGEIKSETKGKKSLEADLVVPTLPKLSVGKPKINFLSYSQIDTFLTCPMHYYLRYVVFLPTDPSAAQSFGISIHGALKDIYTDIKNNKKLTNRLITNSISKNWVSDGYLSREHEDKAKEKASEYLKEYFEKSFNPSILPSVMEQSFSITITKDGQRPLKLGGTIDRIDDLGNGMIEIIDYKTGSNIPSQREVDKNLQLTIYAMTRADVDKVKLSLYYFETQTKISTTRTKADIENAKEEILKIRDEIEASDFSCSQGFFCQNCEYKQFCV